MCSLKHVKAFDLLVVSKFVMNCPAQPPRRGDHAGTWFSHGKALTDLPLLQDARTDLIGLAYIWIMFGLLACVYSTYITLHILHPRWVKCVIKRSSWLSQGSDCAFSNVRLVLGYCIPPRMSSYLSSYLSYHPRIWQPGRKVSFCPVFFKLQ